MRERIDRREVIGKLKFLMLVGIRKFGQHTQRMWKLAVQSKWIRMEGLFAFEFGGISCGHVLAAFVFGPAGLSCDDRKLHALFDL